MQNAYKEVLKQLLPMVLFPSTKEYRMALEKYLDDHTDHFIDDVGRNSWVLLFEEKLLPEVSEILELLIINHKNISNYFIFLEIGRASCRERV